MVVVVVVWAAVDMMCGQAVVMIVWVMTWVDGWGGSGGWHVEGGGDAV